MAWDAAAQTSGAAAALPLAGAAPSGEAAASPADDIAMPADLGAPLTGAAPLATKGDQASAPDRQGARMERLSVNTPIDVIAASPQGKAVLEHDLPGLCERPEYMMFKSMSPAKLAMLSNGRISHAKLRKMQAHLVEVSVTTTAEPPRHNLLAEGGVRVKRFSRAVYRKVLSAIESL